MTASSHALPDQFDAFRASAVHAGGDAPVPTCPGWDVRRLVRHLAQVYATVRAAVALEPSDGHPDRAEVPEEFDAALSFLDEQFSSLADDLSTVDPERPMWPFFPGSTLSAWTRRMTHETAIHRLDAAMAAGEHVREPIFDSELAADGVDEMLSVLLPMGDWSGKNADGRVLYHAADAGRTWLVIYRPGQAPEVGVPHDAALDASEVDATVAGTADAVYRRVWGRPSAAVITGDAELAGVAAGQ